MTEEDDKIENVYLLVATESELSAIAEILQNAHYWHSEMLRLADENIQLRKLMKLQGESLNHFAAVIRRYQGEGKA